MSEESSESFVLPSPTSQSIERDPFDFSSEEEVVIEQEADPEMSTTGTAGTGTSTVPKPKFGGTAPSGSMVWLGGPPLQDWSTTSLLGPATPMCWRSSDPVTEMKAYPRRTDGNEVKFKRDDPEYPLLSFANDAFAHMQTHGMDTLFYMKGVDGQGQGGHDLFRYHSRYTKTQVEEYVRGCTGELATPTIGPGKVDAHGLSALFDSGTWLLNSLHESLRGPLRPVLPPRPTGPVVWMAIVGEVQMESLRRVTDMVKKFEAMKVSHFKGENVRDYCTAASSLLLQLEREDQVPSTHLLTIVDALSEVSVQAFAVMWMAKKRDVDSFIRDSAGKDPMVARSLPNYIHFQSLLDTAKSDYQNLLHKWGPQQLPSKTL